MKFLTMEGESDWPAELKEQVREIFFQTAVRPPSSESDRLIFENAWLSPHLNEGITFVAVDEEAACGYLTVLPNNKILDLGLNENKSLSLFSDLWEIYPTHLHINVHPRYQGKGLGAQLIKTMESELKTRGFHGVFLVTSSQSRNCDFYRRNGFEEIGPRMLGTSELSAFSKKF